MKAISHSDDDLHMPPRVEKLPDSVIADFRRWIKRGAVDPRDNRIDPAKERVRERNLWAYQPPSSPTIPNVGSDWCRSEIDCFVLDKMRSANLYPSADAAPETLLRRLHFDLVGLPPTPMHTMKEFAPKFVAETGFPSAAFCVAKANE